MLTFAIQVALGLLGAGIILVLASRIDNAIRCIALARQVPLTLMAARLARMCEADQIPPTRENLADLIRVDKENLRYWIAYMPGIVGLSAADCARCYSRTVPDCGMCLETGYDLWRLEAETRLELQRAGRFSR